MEHRRSQQKPQHAGVQHVPQKMRSERKGRADVAVHRAKGQRRRENQRRQREAGGRLAPGCSRPQQRRETDDRAERRQITDRAVQSVKRVFDEIGTRREQQRNRRRRERAEAEEPAQRQQKIAVDEQRDRDDVETASRRVSRRCGR